MRFNVNMTDPVDFVAEIECDWEPYDPGCSTCPPSGGFPYDFRCIEVHDVDAPADTIVSYEGLEALVNAKLDAGTLDVLKEAEEAYRDYCEEQYMRDHSY